MNQNRMIQSAIKHCEENPESTKSGLYGIVSGEPATCATVLEKYKD